MKPHFWDEMREGQTLLTAKGWWAEQMMVNERVYEERSGKHSPLKTLLDYWTAKQSGCDPTLHELGIKVHSIDVTGDWPFAFRWIGHDGLTFGSLLGQSVGDVDNTSIATMTAEHYMLAKQYRRPMYHHIEQSIGSMNREYTRLMLPPIDGVIHYAVRPIAINWQSPLFPRDQPAQDAFAQTFRPG